MGCGSGNLGEIGGDDDDEMMVVVVVDTLCLSEFFSFFVVVIVVVVVPPTTPTKFSLRTSPSPHLLSHYSLCGLVTYCDFNFLTRIKIKANTSTKTAMIILYHSTSLILIQ